MARIIHKIICSGQYDIAIMSWWLWSFIVYIARKLSGLPSKPIRASKHAKEFANSRNKIFVYNVCMVCFSSFDRKGASIGWLKFYQFWILGVEFCCSLNSLKGKHFKKFNCVFWDCYGISSIDRFQKGRIINSDYYIAMLKRLGAEITKKNPHIVRKKVLSQDFYWKLINGSLSLCRLLS